MKHLLLAIVLAAAAPSVSSAAGHLSNVYAAAAVGGILSGVMILTALLLLWRIFRPQS